MGSLRRKAPWGAGATTLFGEKARARHAEWLAIAVAVSLPWSTSLTAIFAVLWLLTLISLWNVAALRDEVSTAAGGAPVALWALAAVGMLWAGIPLAERLGGLGVFHKLLAIPFLIAQFRRSDRGMWVLIGFLASCMVLLVVSWGLVLLPGLPWRGRVRTSLSPQMLGIPVKDYISQSAMFTLCIFGLAEGAFIAWQRSRRRFALGLVLLALLFLGNILFVATSRTALAVVPILLLVLGTMRLGWKGAVAFLFAMIALVVAAWPISPYLRARVINLFEEVQDYKPGAAFDTSAGFRLEFWRESIVSIADAPLFGHGTGSIREEFSREAASGTATVVTPNPHNQVLATAIQLGFVGMAILVAMWIAHLRLFCRAGLEAEIGVAVVLQNVVSSLFNSSLFDFTPGWAYVWGVGVLGGMVLRAVPAAADDPGLREQVQSTP